MRRLATATRRALPLAFLLLVISPKAIAQDALGYQIPRSTVVPIKDGQSSREYELYVKLPERYGEDPAERFPVIYTTDADWHFDMLSGATSYLLPDVILVGISWQTNHTDERPYISRFRDYTVVPSQNHDHQQTYQFGRAQDHLSFIRNDVFKYVDENYRTDPTKRTYFGYSLGAAFGAFTLIEEPETFRNYILGSPALSERALKHLDEIEEQGRSEAQFMRTNVIVTLGELEADEQKPVQQLLSLLERRRQHGAKVIGIETIVDADHTTAFPDTVIRAVKWLADMGD